MVQQQRRQERREDEKSGSKNNNNNNTTKNKPVNMLSWTHNKYKLKERIAWIRRIKRQRINEYNPFSKRKYGRIFRSVCNSTTSNTHTHTYCNSESLYIRRINMRAVSFVRMCLFASIVILRFFFSLSLYRSLTAHVDAGLVASAFGLIVFAPLPILIDQSNRIEWSFAYDPDAWNSSLKHQ